MHKLRGKNTFYCFSPGVMLATFAIEIVYIAYILLRYKASPLTRIGTALIFCLAMFQLTEYFICEVPGFSGEVWSRVGFISITLLPPLGIHFVYAMAGRSWNNVIAAAYGTAVAWIIVFAFLPNIFGPAGCSGNYAIFDFRQLGNMYFIFYYFWLYVGTLMTLKFWLKLGKSQRKTRRAMIYFMISYLALLVPTMIVNMVKLETNAGIPSIMCGFAIIMASLITFLIVPRLAIPKKQKNKK